MHRLKGLAPLVPVTFTDTVLGDEGWVYTTPVDAGPGIAPVRHHYELYLASEPTYTGKVSVPVLWDRFEARIVNNESADIMRIFNFKCNVRRLEDYPVLSNYARELFQWPGVRDTVRFDDIRTGYYSIDSVNPSGIVARAPAPAFDRPHDRDRLAGRGVYDVARAA